MSLDVKNFRLSFFRKMALDDIEQFRSHVDGVEKYLEKDVKDLLAYHEQKTEGLSAEEKDEYYEFYSDEYWQLNEIFPNIQRKSELIGIYTIVEHYLNLLCSIYEQDGISKVKLKDLKGQGIIDRARKYLVKVVEIDFPSQADSWSEIRRIQNIRNLFVHNDGVLKGNDSDKSSIKEYIANSNYLKLDQFEKIVIERGFTDYCLQQFGLFFDKLCDAVDEYERKI